MNHSETVKKLCEKTGITPSLACDALESAGWSILDAVVALEKAGVIAPITSSTSTSDASYGYGEIASAANLKAGEDRRKKRKKKNDDTY